MLKRPAAAAAAPLEKPTILATIEGAQGKERALVEELTSL